MADQEFLDRAKRILRLVRQHQHLRNVADEVTVVRECLVMAAAAPDAIGVSETELVEMVRNGFMAEARIIFELACDKAASAVEKDFFFSELVSLIAKAVASQRPVARPIALLPEPAKAESPLEEIERLKAEQKRLAAELEAATARIEELRARQDADNAALLAKLDPSNGLVPFEGLSQLAGPGGDVDDLDFDGAFGEGVALAPPITSGKATLKAVPADDDDPGPFIELTESDIEEEDPVIEVIAEALLPDAPAELVAGPISPDEACVIRFFGEKDAIALGLLYPLVNVKPRRRTTPPPLPPRERMADDQM